MSVATIKQKLGAGEVSLGGWLTLGSPSAAELMASFGFDWFIIEGEHAAAGLDNVQSLLQAMNGSDTVPVMRVPSNDRAKVKVALDIGVKGIMFPMVNTREDALEAVRACKYPPEGVRGIGPGRASLWGLGGPDYFRTANESILIFVIAEQAQAVENIEEIVAVPGIDAVFFGFADYAASIGLTGQINHPRVVEARDWVVDAAKRAGVAMAYAVSGVEQAKEMAALGFQVLAVGSDASFMAGAARSTLAQIKGAL